MIAQPFKKWTVWSESNPINIYISPLTFIYVYIYMHTHLWIWFHIGNHSGRSSHPFHSDIDWSWLWHGLRFTWFLEYLSLNPFSFFFCLVFLFPDWVFKVDGISILCTFEVIKLTSCSCMMFYHSDQKHKNCQPDWAANRLQAGTWFKLFTISWFWGKIFEKSCFLEA